jgi:exodeoxyribonuclease V alpha subunit
MSALGLDTGTSVRAAGLVGEFAAAGVLTVTDVQAAAALMRIGRGRAARQSGDDPVELAAALCVRALRHGSVALDLTTVAGTLIVDQHDEPVDTSDLAWPDPDEWLEQCGLHPLVAAGTSGGDDRPLRLVSGLLYLQKYWQQESLIRTVVADRCTTLPVAPDRLARGLGMLPFDDGSERQRLACAVAALRRFTILAGGPGTGKTTTIARILVLLQSLADQPLHVALAAPTGKAAARMQEATTAEIATMSVGAPGVTPAAPDASTVHRLLGWRPGASTRFAHDRGNPLPHDVVVVDESSMVSVTLMARLLDAVRPDARVILVGDPDQLASIDAGAVLADLVAVDTPADQALTAALHAVVPETSDVPVPATGTVTLTHIYRFEDHIATLAQAIRDGDGKAALEQLRSGHPDIEFIELTPGDRHPETAAIHGLRDDVVAAAAAVRTAALAGQADEALSALDRHRLLCAHRHGPFGVSTWTDISRDWIARAAPDIATPTRDGWTIGQPLIVTANDYGLGLFNGDVGVIVAGSGGEPVAAFDRSGTAQLIPPVRLDAVSRLDAMTIHRGQGSQFAAVSVILPPPESPLLTRELLYTAVTRAQQRVRIIGSPDSVLTAVGRRVNRASGLRQGLQAALADR